jgi:hypothetical protein
MPRSVGRPKNPPKFKDVLYDIIPSASIFDDEELKMFKGLMDIYLNDFDESQLSANDLDDIMLIATNRVLEIRLLKTMKGNPDMQIDGSATIERLRKQTDKLKENLATRRKDRVDPKKFSGISIVDLAVAFDHNKKDLMNKVKQYAVEDMELLTSEEFIGNRNDQDAEVFDVEEN